MSMTVGGKHQAKTIQTGAVSSAKKAKGPTTIHNDPYSRALSLYQLPPTGEVTPEEFETLALDRIKFLKWLEAAQKKVGQRDVEVQWKVHCRVPIPDKNDLKNDPAEAREQIRRDVISHFALRLAYRSDSHREWLVKMETEFLKLRLKSRQGEFVENNPECQVEEAYDVPGEFAAYSKATKFYSIDFTEVLELVADRRVCLKEGKAFVPNSEKDEEARILRIFRSRLESSLKRANEAFGRVKEENLERMTPFIDGLPKQYLGKEFVGEEHEGAPIELSDLNRLAAENFPLCMKLAHEHLRREHHMPHLGRLQYGLFLKAIGLTLEQSMDFWHDEFAARAGEDGWKKKNYAYNIKYNYGQVGRRISWAPYNCQKIVALPADQADPHGCPFRTRNRRTLEDEMSSFDPKQRKEVLQLASDKNYTAACIAFFEARYGPSQRLESYSLHPNLYFIESRREDRISGDGTVAIHTSDASASGDGAAAPSTGKFMDLDASSSMYDEMMDDVDYDALATQASSSQKMLDDIAPPPPSEDISPKPEE